MKFVVPISSSDSHLLDNWTDVVLKFGNLSNHSISLLPTPSSKPEADQAANRLAESGVHVEVLEMQMNPTSGWPTATNVMFFDACRLMLGRGQPWMWMELDCLPVRSNWADALAGAYSSGGSRFLGCVVKTPWRDETTGKIVKSPEGDSDDMMCGCGIYPADMANIPEIQPLLNDFMKGGDSAPQGFDIYLRHVIKIYGRAHTPLIEDKWNTGNYTFSNGVLSCKRLDSHEGINPAQERIPLRGTTVSLSAATLHGCKDDSLHGLIMGGLDLAAIKTVAQSTETFTPPAESQEVAALKSEVTEMKIMLREALAKLSSAPDVPQKAVSPIIIATQSASQSEEKESVAIHNIAPASVSGSGSILDKLVTLMSESPKKIRLDQASEKLNIPINKLKAAIDAPNSPVKKGALGWLSFAGAAV